MKKFEFRDKALKPAAAHQILSNVFRQCDIEPNSVSLESITDYSNYRRQKFAVQRSTIYTVLLLFMLLPVLFITGTIIWTLNQDNTYTVTTDSLIPADSIDASIDGHNVPAASQEDGSFLLSPNRNGEMNITVTLKNRQEISATVTVTGVDEYLPVLGGITYGESCFFLSVSDPDSGINYDMISVKYEDGTDYTAWSCDSATGTIRVDYPDRIIYVNVPDMSDNVLRLQLLP